MILWKSCYELPRTCSWWEGIGGDITVVHPDGKAKSMTSKEFAVHYVSRRPAPGEIRDELQAREAEVERLRARVEVLETVREAAQKTIERWDMLFGNEVCLPAIDEKFDVLRAALKEAKP